MGDDQSGHSCSWLEMIDEMCVITVNGFNELMEESEMCGNNDMRRDSDGEGRCSRGREILKTMLKMAWDG